jgi:cell division protein FtsL
MASSSTSRQNQQQRPFPLWIFPVLIVMAISTVWLRLYIVRTTYEIDQAESMMRNLSQEREQAELKVTGLRSPRRLEAIAKAKYGLSQPRAEQVVHLKGKGNISASR